MALDKTKFERTAGGLRKQFHYITPDTAAVVGAAGYFDGVSDQLDQFDLILCVVESTGVPKTELYAVTSASRAAAVTVTATEASAAT